MNHRIPLLLTLFGLIGVGCSGPTEPPSAVSVVISKDSVMLLVNDSITLSAQIFGSKSKVLNGRVVSWSSQDTTVATVSSMGLVKTHGQQAAVFRSTLVIATADNHSDTAHIFVKPLSPSLTIASSKTTLLYGDSTIITWMASRSIRCEGFGRIPPSAFSPNGSHILKPTQGGRQYAGIQCNGDGGEIRDSILITSSHRIFGTSYLNAQANFVPPNRIGDGGSPTCGVEGRRGGATNARVYADFRNDGSITIADNITSMPWGATQSGILCFWEQKPNDELRQWWEIDPAEFVSNREGSWGGARKGLVADYNGDRRPDVFFIVNLNELANENAVGGYSLLLLSRADGKYNKVQQDIRAYAHGGSAGDVDLDGDPDILFSNLHDLTDGTPGFVTILQNDGRGNFTRRDDMIDIPSSYNCTNHEQELIDVDEDSRLDAILMSSGCPLHILWGDPNGAFRNARIPTLVPWGPYPQCNQQGNSPHNVHKVGQYIYVWDLCYVDATRTTWQIVKLKIGQWSSEVIWRGSLPGMNGSIFFSQGCFRHDYVGSQFCVAP